MSNETKFTEGEWVVYDVDDGWGVDEGELIIGMASYNDDYSNHFCSHKILIEDSNVESRANAHLIAAAPEMYKILDFIYKELNGVEESICWGDIKNLLSKARGEV